MLFRIEGCLDLKDTLNCLQVIVEKSKSAKDVLQNVLSLKDGDVGSSSLEINKIPFQ